MSWRKDTNGGLWRALDGFTWMGFESDPHTFEASDPSLMVTGTVYEMCMPDGGESQGWRWRLQFMGIERRGYDNLPNAEAAAERCNHEALQMRNGLKGLVS